MKPTPYNNNATKHPLASTDVPKPHDVEVVKLEVEEQTIAETEPDNDEIELVEKWDDVEIKIKPND